MADKNKFEQMLEKLISEDRAGAEELFHEIVVEKSRTIYEKLLDDDTPEVEVDEAKSDEKADEDEKVDEKSDEKADDKDEVVDEKADEKADEDEKEVKEELVDITPVEDVPTEAPDMGGDPADAMIGDIEADPEVGDEEGDDAGDDEDLEDRVVDLEDALDDLKAEFDAMMGDNDSDDDAEGDADPEMDMDAGDDEGDDDAEEEAVDATSDLEAEQPAFEGKEAKADAPTDQVELMREYVTKVSGGHGAETKGSGETGGTNTKSTVASKNDMGGEAKNIATGGEGTGGSHTGLTGNDTKEDSAGNVNVPGGKASKSLKSDSKGHGTEKKGKGEDGGTNTDSVIGS